jgi:hypothetical protein
MSFHPRSDQPVSVRHAFALAFDIAVRRVLVRAPFILIPAFLAPLEHPGTPPRIYVIASCALIADYLLLLVTSSMMRFRARSVFNTPPEVRPESATSCIRKALARLPWLFVTELVRNLALAISFFVLVVPGIFFGFRLSCATEAVVLDEQTLASSFKRSFYLTNGRFERWMEMVTISAFCALALILVMSVLALLFPAPGYSMWFAATQVLMVAVTSLIQYAWTFFYLRLVEIESPVVEEGPLRTEPGRTPHLLVIEPEEEERERNA